MKCMIETRMHLSNFAKMRKSCENLQIFEKFYETSYSKTKNSAKFDSGTACIVYAVSLILVSKTCFHFINKH
jgi:hypothetical protein